MSIEIATIQNDIAVLRQFISQRLHKFFKRDNAGFEDEKGMPAFSFPANGMALNADEQFILFLALIPHMQPNYFESIIQEFLPQGGDFPEFGGVRGSNHRGLLPTGETIQFLLASNDFNKRMQIQKMLLGESILIKENILELEQVKQGEPVMSGRIIISDEWLHKLLTGSEFAPKFSNDFPAKKISTKMTWDDLVLNTYTQEQINDILVWLQHNRTIMNDEVLSKKIKPGYRILFHGPSGTGKTLTATLLGKHFQKDVYRIDLSQVVSKYIGETEKNLEKVFSKAENKDWILFFDEADALFGKRTNVQNAHDRYANQEVSYLLQRIEDYPGLLILASNFKSNLDSAFTRRFHAVVHFPAPNASERLKLWEKTMPCTYKPEPTVNFIELASKYELTGASIVNVVHYATLKTIALNSNFIRVCDIIEGIRKEFRKEERTMN